MTYLSDKNCENALIRKEESKNSYELQKDLNEKKTINNSIIEMSQKMEGYCVSEYFELSDYISSGSTGEVYLGKFKKTEKYAALKFLIQKKDNKKRENKNVEDQNHTEILIHNKLKHRNIPDIYGYYQIEGGTCIAMEFCKYDLRNFKKQLLKRSFSETLLCFISFQILDAILNLQKNKIIHLDIKPQNILVDEYLNVKLCDFSISLNYSSEEKYINLERTGTPYFMSPETLGEETIETDEASKIDIYSFGVLIYLLAYCDYPYEIVKVNDKDYSQILKNIKEKELIFPKNPNHSEMFQNFLRKCLEKDIKKRYNIYNAMRDPWIKAHEYILNEKEKLNNGCKFLMYMMANNIFEFNKSIKRN